MAKQIKYDKMHSTERAYRIIMTVTYLLAAVAVLSCIFTVPGMENGDSSPVLIIYSAVFLVYVLLLCVDTALAVMFFKKTGKEYAAVQAFLLFIAAAFTAANLRIFIVFFLYGAGLDDKIEKLFGENMSTLVDNFTTGWMMLAIAFGITMLLGILSIIRLAAKKYS